mmetsp:Transcript_7401/g.994  ORF Transcript_7401/g.994 Transcript_7401/m.994 type:complete len:114 (+) Transcript_7401:157-498(+)
MQLLIKMKKALLDNIWEGYTTQLYRVLLIRNPLKNKVLVKFRLKKSKYRHKPRFKAKYRLLSTLKKEIKKNWNRLLDLFKANIENYKQINEIYIIYNINKYTFFILILSKIYF